MTKINKPLLQSYIVLNDGSQKVLATAIGISLSRLNAKINEKGGAEFNQGEMSFIKDRYHLTDDVFVSIFFNDSVSNLDTKTESQTAS